MTDYHNGGMIFGDGRGLPSSIIETCVALTPFI